MDRVRAAARNAGIREPAMGAVYLRLRVYTAYDPLALQSGDLDNHAKLVKDALSNGLAFRDDRQVVHVEVRKDQDREHPRIEVEIAAEVPAVVSRAVDSVKRERLDVDRAEESRREGAALLACVRPRRRAKVKAGRLVTSVRRFS
jgi:hypothetical protein